MFDPDMVGERMLGTDEELSERLRTHDDYIMKQRQKRKAQEAHLEDAEELIKSARTAHVELMGRQGEMLAEERVGVLALCIILVTLQIRLAGGGTTYGRARGTCPGSCCEISYQRFRAVPT